MKNSFLYRFSSFDCILALYVFFISLMIGVRIIYTESNLHLYLIWNIFLAWIPYYISKKAIHLHQKPKWKQLITFFAWLLFFPNSMYLITDLVHVEDSTLAPIWYDVMLLFSASFAGIILSYCSLQYIRRYLLALFSPLLVSFILPIIIFIASFGVYLGRFQRWNSWDIIQSPLLLLKDIAFTIIHPQRHFTAWVFTVIFTVSILFVFYFFNYFRSHHKDLS